MSKLDGNERWKSKMLLTEHAEQYDKQQAPPVRKPLTPEERKMIRDFILLPHTETMVQKSISGIEGSDNILKRLYLSAGHTILGMVSEDYYRIRTELRKRNIRVLAEEQEDLVVYHKCYCRGYEERFGLTRDVMRSEIAVKLTTYTAELASRLKGDRIK